MRIAYINTVAGYGSTGRLVDQLAGMQGIKAKIYYGRKKNLSKWETYRVTDRSGNVIHALETRLFDKHGFSNTQETYRMIEDLKAFRPDIIHLHNLHGYYLNAEVLFHFLQQISVPVIWTLHDCWAFTGHCVHYEAVNCSKWQTECYECPQLGTYYKTYNRNSVRHNYQIKKELFTSLGSRLHLAVPSQWLKEQIQKSFLKDTECTVIPNGIDLNDFHPVQSDCREKYKLGENFVVLACSSKWTERKGLNALVELSFHMPQNTILCVVGLNKKQEKMFSDHTICIERTDSIHDLACLYSSADLFINLTQEETFSLVNVEAQACGCPVMTYRSGGSTEMISSDSGIAVEKNSISDLCVVISDISDGKIVFGRDACIKNAELFSLDNMYDGYMMLYRKILEGNV